MRNEKVFFPFWKGGNFNVPNSNAYLVRYHRKGLLTTQIITFWTDVYDIPDPNGVLSKLTIWLTLTKCHFGQSLYAHVRIAVFIFLYLPFSNNVALKKGLQLQIVETTLSGSFKIFCRKPIMRGNPDSNGWTKEWNRCNLQVWRVCQPCLKLHHFKVTQPVNFDRPPFFFLE